MIGLAVDLTLDEADVRRVDVDHPQLAAADVPETAGHAGRRRDEAPGARADDLVADRNSASPSRT